MAQNNKAAAKQQPRNNRNSKNKSRSKSETARLQTVAQMLFVDRGLEQKVISGIIDVSEATISKWKIAGDWETLREEVMVGPEQEMRRLRTMLRKHLDDLEKKGKFPDAGEADAIKKITSAIKDLIGDDVLTMHKYTVGMKFIEYIQDTHGHAKTIELTELWTEFLMKV